MKTGKVSQTVFRRSILKQLQTKRKESVIPLSVEEMCAAIEVESESQMVVTDASYYGNEKNLGVFVIAKTINDLASRGAKPIGIQVNIQLPTYAYESRLKAMIEYMEQICQIQQIQILSVKAEINPVINSSIVHVTTIGSIVRGQLISSSMGCENQDIVVINWVGLEGMLRILNEKEEELSKRFVPGFIQQIKQMEDKIFAVDAIQYAIKAEASAIHQVAGGGILAALWEMAEASGVGLEVELKKIPIKQETIEVCEYYQINPYQLTSVGSMLVFVPDGEQLVLNLRAENIEAVVIGRTTSSKERVIFSGEDKRFIDRPLPDELAKIYTKTQEEL